MTFFFVRGSIADLCGQIEEGDIIVAVNGTDIQGMELPMVHGMMKGQRMLQMTLQRSARVGPPVTRIQQIAR